VVPDATNIGRPEPSFVAPVDSEVTPMGTGDTIHSGSPGFATGRLGKCVIPAAIRRSERGTAQTESTTRTHNFASRGRQSYRT
jgi:hypothetical protein